ncbi:acetolactate synthase 2 small subunit [Aliikangiella sp. IMCC44359]|uniref:acetolactate synthase 2 small subunit n=1 Tax=Aliikangiella sp. IMCC44359 TaxID=3459125 RepID=UPI00403B142E
MNQHLVKIKAYNEATTLEQLLRVIRYRGFKVDRISMNVEPLEQMVDIELNVKSKRPISLLENQLTKLVDIKNVYVEESAVIQVPM